MTDKKMMWETMSHGYHTEKTDRGIIKENILAK